MTIVFGAAALSASHPPLPPRCGDEIFDASSLRLDIPANCRCVAAPHAQPFTLEAAQLSLAHTRTCVAGSPSTHASQPTLTLPSRDRFRSRARAHACAQRVHSPVAVYAFQGQAGDSWGSRRRSLALLARAW